MNLFEIIGTVTGILGTIILSTKLSSITKWRFRVFIIYFISNLAMIMFAYHIKAYALLTMNVVYMFTSINGLRNNRNG